MMAFIAQFWLPILAATVAVFVVSALIWMVAPHHKTEWRTHPNEAQVLSAIRSSGATPGAYLIPHSPDQKAMKDPAFQAKLAEGPLGTLFLRPPGMPNMGRLLTQQFIFFLVVNIFLIHVAWYVLNTGAPSLQVFHLVAIIGFMTFGFGVVPESIWFGRPWKSCILSLIDALIYALVVAAVIGYLWPASTM